MVAPTFSWLPSRASISGVTVKVWPLTVMELPVMAWIVPLSSISCSSFSVVGVAVGLVVAVELIVTVGLIVAVGLAVAVESSLPWVALAAARLAKLLSLQAANIVLITTSDARTKPNLNFLVGNIY